MKLQSVTTNSYPGSNTVSWKESFNQVLFLNYDPNDSLWVNQIEIKPAITDTVSGEIYPTKFAISLNAGEVNYTRFIVDVKGSTTGSFNIVYTLYIEQ